MGGTMCPSYMATHDERDTTRARANMLREVLTRSPKANPFDSDEIAAEIVQIKDGTGRIARHPLEILAEALATANVNERQ
jgi:hypothetical protein